MNWTLFTAFFVIYEAIKDVHQLLSFLSFHPIFSIPGKTPLQIRPGKPLVGIHQRTRKNGENIHARGCGCFHRYYILTPFGVRLKISIDTVIRTLCEDLGYNYRHLRWVPHVLTIEVISQCLEDSNKSHFDKIMTGDESWFLYLHQPTYQWVLQNENPQDIVSKTKN